MRSSIAAILVASLWPHLARADLLPFPGPPVPPGQVRQVIELRDGSLVLSGEMGLWRFDGFAFEKLDLDPGVEGRVVALAKSSGGFSALTDRGDVAEWRTGRWRTLARVSAGGACMARKAVAREPETASDGVWVCGPDGIWDVSAGAARLSLPGSASRLTEGDGGQVFAVVGGAGFVSDAEGRWRALGTRPGWPAAEVVAIGGGETRGLMVATSDEVTLLRPGTVDRWRVQSDRWTTALAWKSDRPSGGLVATGYGLWELEAGRPATLALTASAAAPVELSDGTIVLSSPNLPRYVPRVALTIEPAFRAERIHTVRAVGDDQLWVSTTRGVRRRAGSGWVPVECAFGLDVWMVARVDDEVWLSDRSAVYVTDPHGVACRALTLDGRPTRHVYAVIADGAEHVWLGTGEDLVLARRSGGQLIVVRRIAVGAVTDFARSGPWVVGASARGLIRLPDARETRGPEVLSAEPDGVIDVLARSGGEVCWVPLGRRGARCAALGEGGQLGPIADFRAGEHGFGLAESWDGGLWLGTERGLVGLSDDTRVSGALGLPGSNVSRNALLAERDGLWVGTAEGLAFVRISDPWFRPLSPRLGVTWPHSWIPLAPRLTLHPVGFRDRLQVELLGPGGRWGAMSGPELAWGLSWANVDRLTLRARYLELGTSTPLEVPRRDVLSPRVRWATLTLLGALAVLVLLIARERVHRLAADRARRVEVELEARRAEVEALSAALGAAERRAAESQLSLGFAHEIRNSLGAARIVVQTLRRDLTTRSHDEAVDVLDAAVARALELSRRVLEFGRAGHGAPTVDQTSLSALVPKVLVQLSLGDVARAFDGPGWVGGRQDDVWSVVENLVRNAREAGGEPAGLTLRVRTEVETTSLVVEDAGPGFTAQALAHATEPFFTTRPGGHGVGLGLSIVARIVEIQGGRLSLENKPEGGARVTVCWPRPR